MNRYIAPLLLIFSPFAFGECPSAVPEETLECYFNAVDSKNEQAIKNVYLGMTGYHFNVPVPPKREILTKAVLAENSIQHSPDNEVPIWARKGNITFLVSEVYPSYTLQVSFSLTQVNKKWYLAGHSALDQPE